MSTQPGILGVITARGGSKRVPRKNLVSINGKPLLAYTCQAALASTLLTRTVLSTDDEEIATVGRRYGVEVPVMRPANLATDDADSLAVVTHVLETLKEREQYVPEIVVLLQPTSPLRTGTHIDESIVLLRQTNADSVVSVVEVPHVFVPSLLLQIQEGRLMPAMPSLQDNGGKIYAYNGALYTLKIGTFGSPHKPFGRDCRPYVMSQQYSLDVDTEYDVCVAEHWLRMLSGS